jgi:hypothetical protein
LDGGVNTYGYVKNNPLSFVDYLGLAPGDPYLTIQDAAIDALCENNPQSIADDKEYSGAIYAFDTPNGERFSYTRGTPGGGDTSPLVVPSQGEWVAMYHTHGAYNSSPEYVSDPRDPGVNRNTNYSNYPPHDSDIPLSEEFKLPSYMVDPLNNIHLYNPWWTPEEKKRRGRKGQIIGECPCEN